jgi:hypothetical protein
MSSNTQTDIPANPQRTFTPGPWTFTESAGASNSYKIEGDGLSIRIYGRDCHLSNGPRLKVGRTQANARLIAASPAMYAAIVGLLNAIHDSMLHESQRFHADEIAAAYAALAQVEGKQ